MKQRELEVGRHELDRLLIVTVGAVCFAAICFAMVMTLAFLHAAGITIKDFDGAAWTQAVGSVAAILVAVWVSHRQNQHTERQANLRIASGVRLKASIVRTLVKIAIALVEGAYRTWINDMRCRSLPFEPYIVLGLERGVSDISLTVESLDQFSAAEMACGPEAIMWSTARVEARRLRDLCGEIQAGKVDPLEGIEATIERMQMIASNLDRLALVLEAGDWKGASDFVPSNPARPEAD